MHPPPPSHRSKVAIVSVGRELFGAGRGHCSGNVRLVARRVASTKCGLAIDKVDQDGVVHNTADISIHLMPGAYARLHMQGLQQESAKMDEV